MKKIFYITILAIIFFSCEKDTDFTNNPPQIDLLTPSLSGSIGETVTIRADLSDDYVLKHVKIISLPLAIDNTVLISIRNDATKADQDVIKSSEDFTYDLTIPSLAVSGESYDIKLEVKNVTGQTSNAIVTLNIP